MARLGKDWSAHEVETLIRLYRANNSAWRIGDFLKRSKASVGHKIERLCELGILERRGKGTRKGILEIGEGPLPGLPKTYKDFITVYADKVLIISDIHLPFTDFKFFDLLCRVALAQGIDTVILGGDIFDLPMFSTFPEANLSGRKQLVDTQAISIRFFNKLIKTFKHVYGFAGNHDFRAFKYTGGKLQENDILDFLTRNRFEDRIKFSNYKYMMYGKDCRIVHPSHRSTNFILDGTRQASKYLNHIIYAHVHKAGHIFDPSGKFNILGCGCLVDPEKISYNMMNPTGTPEWNPGAVIAWRKKGKFHAQLLTKYHTDFSEWLKKAA